MSVKGQDEREPSMRVGDAKRAWREVFPGNSSGDWVRLAEAEAMLVAAEARKAQLVAALGFYATFDGSIQHLAALTRDGGKTARAALVGVVE